LAFRFPYLLERVYRRPDFHEQGDDVYAPDHAGSIANRLLRFYRLGHPTGRGSHLYHPARASLFAITEILGARASGSASSLPLTFLRFGDCDCDRAGVGRPPAKCSPARLISAATVLPMAMSCPTREFERRDWFTMTVSCSRLGVVRPNSAFRGDGERWRLRSQVSHTNSFAPPFWPGRPGA
jgi:hypothetical protein